MPTLRLSDFSGGLNLRDSATEVPLNEATYAADWVLDTRGALTLRGGCTLAVTLPGTSGKKAWIFYSAALDQWLCARESGGALKLFTRPGDLSGSWTDRGQINASPTAVAAFVDWPGATPLVVLCSALTGSTNGDTRTWDGTTLTTVDGGQGWALVSWQNRVWRIGYPVSGASGNPTRLAACKVGDPATWATASGGLTVDIRDKDGQALTGGGIAGGALIVFKKRSAYRVNDSATGSYSTLDASSGSLPFGVASARGRLYTWGADGLYEWDGVGRGVNVGDKVRPYFFGLGGSATPCGGAFRDRLVFAFPTADVGGLDNARLLEFDPQHGWIVSHAVPNVSAVSSFAAKGLDLYGAFYVTNQLFQMFTGTPGSDNGLAYNDGLYDTPWLQPNDGKLVRINRAQIEGLIDPAATLKMRVFRDSGAAYDEYDLSADLRGSGIVFTRSIVRSLGQARAYGFEFAASGTGPVVVNALTLDWRSLEL